MLCLRNMMTWTLVAAGGISLGACTADTTGDGTATVASPIRDDKTDVGTDKVKKDDNDKEKCEPRAEKRKCDERDSECKEHERKCDDDHERQCDDRKRKCEGHERDCYDQKMPPTDCEPPPPPPPPPCEPPPPPSCDDHGDDDRTW
jgi:hypothetical protein